MPKYLMKVHRGSNYRRINLPKKAIDNLKWGDVVYVTVDDSTEGKLVIEPTEIMQQMDLLPKDGES